MRWLAERRYTSPFCGRNNLILTSGRGEDSGLKSFDYPVYRLRVHNILAVLEMNTFSIFKQVFGLKQLWNCQSNRN